MWSVIHFPFPPVKEQRMISDFLDQKNQEIESLIKKIEKTITISDTLGLIGEPVIIVNIVLILNSYYSLGG